MNEDYDFKLFDQIAIEAMKAIISIPQFVDYTDEEISRCAYNQASSMMKKRESFLESARLGINLL